MRSPHLLDTNVLLRAAEPESREHGAAVQAIEMLLGDEAECFITAQVLIEFWAVATRPRTANGLGWSIDRILEDVARIRRQFPILADTPEIFERWLALVSSGRFSGKRVHDARLVAVMQVYGVHHLLTFNAEDFSGAPEIEVIVPGEI